MEELFKTLQTIVNNNSVVIDRPKNSRHPRYDDYVYPMDYGYLEGTKSQDGEGIDVWCGEANRDEVSGILITADGLKKDSEIKILLGCDKKEMKLAHAISNRGGMTAALIMRGDV